MGKTSTKARAEKADGPAPLEEGVLHYMPISDVIPTKDNQRKIDPKDPALREMAETMKVHGVIQPVAGRPHPTKTGKVELRAGERRYLAAKIAGLKVIPVFVRRLDEQQAQEVTAIENLHRKDLTILEQAAVVQLLLKRKWPIEEIAAHLGKIESWVARRAQIAKLDKVWLTEMAKANSFTVLWSASHFELIARLPTATQKVAHEELTHELRFNDDVVVSVPELQRTLSRMTRALDLAPWDVDDAGLVPKAGACLACPKRSSCDPLLFEDMVEDQKTKGDRCLDDVCWNTKTLAMLKTKIAEAKTKHGGSLVISGDIHNSEMGKMVREWLGEQGWKPNHAFQSAKKSERGAAPVFDAVTGKVSYKKAWDHAGSGRKKKDRPVDPKTGKPKPKPVAERRKDLERRRQAWIVEQLRTEILPKTSWDKLPARSQTLSVMAALVSEFGTDSREEYGGSNGAADWKRVEARFKSSKKSDLHSATLLWKKVRPVLERRLRYNTLDTLPVGDAQALARLIDWDWEDLMKQAADEIPEPKSWAKLKPDGTSNSEKKTEKKTDKPKVKKTPGTKKNTRKKAAGRT